MEEPEAGPAPGRSHSRMSPSRGRSVKNIWAGSCVTMNSTRAFSATACGVTPQPQKTGISFAEQLDDLRRERARRFFVDREPTDQLVITQHRDGDQRAGPRAEEDVAEGPTIGVLHRDVWP
jgi:hypothetical protein